MSEHSDLSSSLPQQIEHLRNAIEPRQSEDPGRTSLYVDLAICLWRYYNQTGSLEAHEEMFEISFKLAAGMWINPSLLLCCFHLTHLLKSRYEEALNDVMILDQAVELGRATVEICPLDHKVRADSCILLASLLMLRYDKTGSNVLLVEVVELERQALDLCNAAHPSRAMACESLALSYKRCYHRTGDIILLDEAITLEREALALRPSHHPDRHKACRHLAHSLMLRHGIQDATNPLNEIVELQREVLALLPADHPDRGMPCTNLALCLKTRCRRTGDVSLLDEAIALEREALNYRSTVYCLDQAVPCVNLAMSLIMRYENTGDVSLLNEAIGLGRKALSLRPVGHSERVATCSSLAVSLVTCYEHTQDIALLDEAIKLDREAYGLCPARHSNRSVTCENLAVLISLRYDRTGEVALLDEAIKLHREALDLRPAGNSDQAEACLNLAVSLTMHYFQSEDVALLDEVIKLHEQALQYGLTNTAWRKLTALCSIHLRSETPHFSLQKAIGYLQHSCENPVDNLQSFMVEVTKRLRTIWLLPRRWTSETTSSLLGIYAELIDRLPMMAGFVLDTPSRLQTLRSFSHIGQDACIAALLAGQLCKAVELLDHAHGVVWAQALHQRDPQLQGVSPELARELIQLLRAIAVPVQSSGLIESRVSGQDIRHEQNTRIRAILHEIRGVPGLERFMLGSTFDMLRNAAHEHPIAILVAAENHVFALIMPSSSQESPDVLRLSLTWEDLRSFADSAARGAFRYRGGSQDIGTDASPDKEQFISVTGTDRAMRPGSRSSYQGPLSQLWSLVVKPVLIHLGLPKTEGSSRRRRLQWCTTGYFASLPIHAAGVYTGPHQECCSDYVVSSYTPTLSSLLRARQGLQPVPTADAKLLLVAADHAASKSLSALPAVKAEMISIVGVANDTGIQYAASSQVATTSEQTTAALPSATLVHIACHGSQEPKEPLKSAFHLGDNDVLSVSDLMELDLKGAYLAFLSACETAKGDREQPDQAIHLAATMLFVGFRSVVATMWAMRDEDGPVIAKAFYEKLFEGETITADAIPYALDHAIRKLRESGAPVERWATFIHVGA